MMHKHTILIADDNAAVRELARVSLQAAGHHVLEAADGDEALAVATRERPDLLILDTCMPRLDGWEVLRRLEAEPTTAGLPAIVLTTGASGTHVVLRGLENGAVQYLSKPFAPEDLIAETAIILDVLTGQMRDQYRRDLIATRRKWMAHELEFQWHTSTSPHGLA